jgi:hypothetical protein
MKRAVVTIEGVSPYGQSKYYQVEKKEKEGSADYEARTWRERMHYDSAGQVFIPPMAFKNCLAETAKFLSVQIPGKGKATYTKHFEAGIMVNTPLVLPVKKEDVKGQWLFVPASGRRGDGKRVQKCFPVIHQWGGDVEFFIIDDTITEEPFKYHIEQAGQLIGIGFFRPRNNGYYGRFKVKKVVFEDYA